MVAWLCSSGTNLKPARHRVLLFINDILNKNKIPDTMRFRTKKDALLWSFNHQRSQIICSEACCWNDEDSLPCFSGTFDALLVFAFAAACSPCQPATCLHKLLYKAIQKIQWKLSNHGCGKMEYVPAEKMDRFNTVCSPFLYAVLSAPWVLQFQLQILSVSPASIQ